MLEELTFSNIAEISTKTAHLFDCQECKCLRFQYIYYDSKQLEAMHAYAILYTCKNSFWIIECLDKHSSRVYCSIYLKLNYKNRRLKTTNKDGKKANKLDIRYYSIDSNRQGNIKSS